MCSLLAFLLARLCFSQSITSVGKFQVTIVQPGGSLEVVADTGRVVSTTQLPWLIAEVGEWKNRHEDEGMFKMLAGPGCGSVTQTIDSVVKESSSSSKGDILTVRGLLEGPKGQEDTRRAKCAMALPRNYSVTLSVAPESAATLRMAVFLGDSDGDRDGDRGDVGRNRSNFERTTLSLAAHATDKVYGLGVQYSFRDFKGKVVPILTSEQGIGRGLQPLSTVLGDSSGNFHTTYSAIPHFMTSSMQSVYLEGSDFSVFDFSRDNETHLTVYNNEFTMRAIAGDSPLELIEEYTAYAGRMPQLPEWITSGPIIGYEGGTDAVAALHERVVAAGIKPAAYWLQDWTGLRQDLFGKRLWWNWELDTDWYHDWDGLCRNLSASTKTRLLTYINPFLANTVTKDKPNARRDYFKEAVALGYLVMTQAGKPYILASGSPSFTFGIVDFTNPAAAAWYSRLIQQNMINECQSGWMADFSEYIPFDAKLFSGNPDTVHNIFPQHWAEVNRNATGSADDAPVFFLRAAHTKSPASSALFWLGDQLVSWDEDDGLKTVVNGHISAGLSGMSLMHSDVGGYTMVKEGPLRYLRQKELLVRWMELSSVIDAVFRTHPGNLPADSWQVYSDDSTLHCFARLAELHTLLGSYRAELNRNATEFGHPLARAMFLHYPKDPIAQTIGSQLMLGPDVLVAPALEKFQTEVEMYLPAGDLWLDPWTSKGYGSKSEPSHFPLPAVLGIPPLLVRATSAVALTLEAGCKQLRSNTCNT